MESKSLWQIILEFIAYLINRKETAAQAQKERIEANENELASKYDAIDKEKKQKQEENKNASIDEIKDRLNNRF